ncbi:MAG: hypothetical protein AAGA96_16390, partial [Verrucomicrobiota bacterium]
NRATQAVLATFFSSLSESITELCSRGGGVASKFVQNRFIRSDSSTRPDPGTEFGDRFRH